MMRVIFSVGFVFLMAQGAMAADDLLAAQKAFDERRFDDALAILDKAVVALPHDAAVHFLRGRTLSILGYSLKAMHEYDEALKIDPKSSRALAWKSLEEVYRSDDRPARQDADRALAIDPRCAPAFATRAQVFEHECKYEQAVAEADKAVAADPNEYRWYVIRALAKNLMKRYTEALADAREAKRIAPDQPRAYSIEAMLLREQKALNEALVSISQGIAVVHNEKDQAFPLLLRERVYVKEAMDLFDKSIEDDLNRLLVLCPNCPSFLELRASYFDKVGETAKALADIDKAIMYSPASKQPERYLSRALFNQAAAGKAHKAALIKEETELDATADNKSATDFYLASVKDFSKALQGPECFSKFALQGRALSYEKLGENKLALADISAYIKLDPKDPGGYLLRRDIRRNLNDNKGADEDADKAEELRGDK